ncbi:hypothetical protein PACTADRAFT_48064 [Pachysolen tannophilus NRRL Y-2460]|uniref:Translation initiation factor eIF2B subunit epsilon n=1 Tax=Pachysolen tannophilus NRRL Y-2460 TaxID=669874 RepID=A0A1E4U2P1_PACTA|nr:hypothetical protein PACTADRAFT_48064 [Pachysolen tannophilus NRRL Y-2460]
MAPKNKKQKEIVQDERLQAIVLTDSYETKFMPLTSVEPRCLLPLCNVPLIEYTLEFLAKAGVDEVYLMCCSHADKVQTYIDGSKWNQAGSPFKINTIMSLESRSVGDAMRDLDNRGLITGDFLLVSGDVVTNIQFDEVLSAHRQRRLIDKDHIVTMVLTQASPLHRTRSQSVPSTFILDKKTDRCLYYQDIPSINGLKASISVDPDLLEDVDEFVIRNDLIDCHVDICSPLVPVIFQENFDYQYLRRDFVRGTLSSDLLKKTIYAYITNEDYAARVESWQTYDAISQDILERWCYPIAPDSNLLEDQSYTYESKHIYKEKDIRLSQSCKIGSCVVIGSNSFIGDASQVENSVIGRNCQIGTNVIIKNSYIWDNSIIKDNCQIEHSIVASNSVINQNVKLNSGSVIGFNVVIGDNVIVAENTRIVERPVKHLSDSSYIGDSLSSDDEFYQDIQAKRAAEEKENIVEVDEGAVNDPAIVGENGIGFAYDSESEYGDYDDDEVSSSSKHYHGLVYKLDELYLSDTSIVSSMPNRRKKRRTYSSASHATATDAEHDYNNNTDGEEDDEEDFNKEAIATVERAMENNHDLDTALLELNTLRMSMNVTYHDVRLATCTALLQRIEHFINTQTLGVKDSVHKIFGKWGQLFKRQVFEDEEQVDLLNILESLCSKLPNNNGPTIFTLALNDLYDNDILDEVNILKWWNQEGYAGKDENTRKVASKWIEWLAEAEEESDGSAEE